MTKKHVLSSADEQLDRWIAGESLHSDHRGLGEECCPDFSCCKPELLQPVEVRVAFKAASPRERERFCMAFLGGMLSGELPGVKVHVVGAEPETPQ